MKLNKLSYHENRPARKTQTYDMHKSFKKFENHRLRTIYGTNKNQNQKIKKKKKKEEKFKTCFLFVIRV